MASRALVLVLAMNAASGCSVLSLDVLQSGEEAGTGDGGRGATGAVSAALTSTSAGSSDATSSSRGGGGAGGAGGTGVTASSSAGEGGGGGPPATSTVTSGGGCADSCEDATATLCDSFDGSDEIVSWTINRDFEVGSTYEIVEDPRVSCPHAVRIDFTGPVGNPGGWAQLYKNVPDQPTVVRFDTRVWRDTDATDYEGTAEVQWSSADKVCILQVYVSPESALVVVTEYDDGPSVELGLASMDLTPGLDTTGAWFDLGIVVEVGDAPHATLEVGADVLDLPLDVAGDALCDDAPPDPDTWRVSIGAPYNSEPITLYYDDFRVFAE